MSDATWQPLLVEAIRILGTRATINDKRDTDAVWRDTFVPFATTIIIALVVIKASVGQTRCGALDAA